MEISVVESTRENIRGRITEMAYTDYEGHNGKHLKW